MINGLRKLNRFHLWLAGLALIMAAGAAGALVVFLKGLVVTNLTDLIPWGLWITIDLSSIALSAGAFTLCAAVYLIGLKEYQPIARTATFVGIIGYSMAMLCLLLDIGRPDRFWHAFVFWNPHSVLWEVTMCVGLYFTVLVLETLPILSEAEIIKTRFPGLAKRMSSIHHFAPYLAIAGLFLSMLHQSSLGATYGVLKSRPIWYTPSLSVLFMFSAILGGISLTLLVSMLAARFNESSNVDDRLIQKLSGFVGWGLAAYLYVRFWYAFSMTYTYEPGRTEGLNLLTQGPLAVNFWLGEIVFGTLIPMIILLKSRWRANPRLMMAAFALIVGGLVAYRWDINLAGQMIVIPYISEGPSVLYTRYIPSIVEIVVGAGVIAYGIAAFSLGVKFLRVVDHGVVEERADLVVEPGTSALLSAGD